LESPGALGVVKSAKREVGAVEVSGGLISALYKAFCQEESRIGISDAQTMKRTNRWSVRFGRLLTAAALLTVGWSAVAASELERQRIASANAAFAFKLLKEIVRKEPGRNLFISPYGASSVLQMACTGASGQTKSEMERLLGTVGLATDVVNTANRDFERMLNGKGANIILSVANTLWYQKGAGAKSDFVASCRQYFGATVDELDFGDARSVGIINAWASEKTHGKITSIADGMINSLTELFLADAVYFKGKWDKPFDAKSTKDRAFRLRGGKQKQVPMMEQSRKFDYRRGTGYEAVRLEYQGWSLGMYVFLPDAGSSPEKLVSIMTGDRWQRVTEPGFTRREGTVVLPKFKLEYGVELKGPLMALGMKTAFEKADFTGISDHGLFVSSIRQRTFIDVNEEGTEAATGMTIQSGLDMNPPRPFQMIVDRPFLFLIEDRETKAILFMGVVFDPGV
jgi:serpin B